MSTGSIVALVILIAAFALLIVETIAEAGVISLSRSRARLLASQGILPQYYGLVQPVSPELSTEDSPPAP